ncbi:peptidase [Agarivorans sp. B2Z047]|uniref:phage protease n=1 Tax=Agarivorans sp. B2Z047 TaxID=2652721 RepID=UPI00128DFB5C|nr:phage protease [Agarivorans sp. B2Z047]MPW30467.1 peptidase [Agarivorans sp. B2Z047]UQN42312.1 phage protease [Agarivorans sp. B2Z047]
MKKDVALALCFSIPATYTQKDTDPLWLMMLPAGEFEGEDGRSFSNSTPQAVVDAFTKPLPFDEEHASVLKAAFGDSAHATGWLEELEVRDGAVWARVEFNSNGEWLINSKAYRFYSPAFLHTADGTVISLDSAGLTNKPNLADLPALNRAQSNMENETVPLSKAIAQALGLTESATDDEAVTAIGTLKTNADPKLALNSAVAKGDFVPKATHQLALNRATTAEARLAEIDKADQESIVDEAIEAGKIAPANRDMYLAICSTQTGRAQFAAYVASAAPIVDSETKSKGKPPQGDGKLEPHELAMCRKMHIKPEEFLKARQAQEVLDKQ